MKTEYQKTLDGYYEKRIELSTINKKRKKLIDLKIQKQKELKEIEEQVTSIMDESFEKQDEISNYLNTVEEKFEDITSVSLANLCKNISFFSSFSKGRNHLDLNNISNIGGNSYSIEEAFFKDFEDTIINNLPNGILYLNDSKYNEFEENGKFIIFNTEDLGEDYYRETGLVYIENIMENDEIEYTIHKGSRNSKYGHYIDVKTLT
jgi:hypothetical protein